MFNRSIFVFRVMYRSHNSGYNNLKHVPFCINPDNDLEPNKGKIEVIEDLLHARDVISGIETKDYAGKTSYIMNRFGVTPPPE